MNYRKAITLAVFSIAFASPAAAEKYGVTFSPTNDQQVRMVHGISAIDSSFGLSGVRIIAPHEPVKKLGVMQIIFFNKSEASFNVVLKM